MSNLAEEVAKIPVIDAHAHCLLSNTRLASPSLLAMLSEASGSAQEHVKHALVYPRALRALAPVLECEATLDSITAARSKHTATELAHLFFRASNIHGILIDDGFHHPDNLPLDSHCDILPVRRIMRIESEAEKAISAVLKWLHFQPPGATAISELITRLDEELTAVFDPPPANVVSFKTIAAYRGGLRIDDWDRLEVLTALERIALDRVANIFSESSPFRLHDRVLRDYVIRFAFRAAIKHDIPVQVHIGLGDTDSDLTHANPLLLRNILHDPALQGLRLVLLHNYPYAREAGFLASLYEHVYVDFGLSIPLLSARGQIRVIQELLELAPTNKVHFSTDGHYFPEGFYLGAEWSRAALAAVLSDSVAHSELSEAEALAVAHDILFNNANTLYKLDWKLETRSPAADTPPQVSTPEPLGTARGPQQPPTPGRAAQAPPSAAEAEACAAAAAGAAADNNTRAAPETAAQAAAVKAFKAASARSPADSFDATRASAAGDLLSGSGAEFVRLLWCDTCNVVRTQVFPLSRLPELTQRGAGLTRALMGFPWAADQPLGLPPVGEVQLVLDPGTLRQLPYHQRHAVAFGDFSDEGVTPFALDARHFLRRALADLKATANVELRVGFESEFVLYESSSSRGGSEGGHDRDDFSGIITPVDSAVWCQAGALSPKIAALLDDIVANVSALDIAVEKFHAESAPGQFELITGFGDAMRAADDLVLTRQTVAAIAQGGGCRATFVPKPFEDQAGSGCHVHVSLWQDGCNVFGGSDGPHGLSKVGEHFMAGVLEHLPALMAITTPTHNSFARIAEHYWSGAFQVWGVENREAPLRLAGGTHNPNFELKTLDATANPYLALGAIIYAGLDGLRRRAELPPPVQVDPATLRGTLGKAPIRELPRSLDAAVQALEADEVLRESCGEELVANLLALRKAECSSWAGSKATELRWPRALLERF